MSVRILPFTWFITHGIRSWTSGAVAYTRYKTLIDDKNMPFIRASLSERVVESALNWSEGQLIFQLFDRSLNGGG